MFPRKNLAHQGLLIIISAPSAKVSGFASDLGTADGCEALVAAHPACDILVNNLGIYGPQDFFETPDFALRTRASKHRSEIKKPACSAPSERIRTKAPRSMYISSVRGVIIAQFMPHLRKCGVARCGVGQLSSCHTPKQDQFSDASPPISQKLSRALLTGGDVITSMDFQLAFCRQSRNRASARPIDGL